MTEAEYSFIAFNAYLSYTTIMLNIATIHVIRKTSSLPKPLQTLLLSLAVSDLGVGLVVQPLYIALIVIENEQNTESKTFYYTSKLYIIATCFLCFASFLGVTALTVDRFLTIHLHLRYQELVTHKRVVACVISIWVFSAFISVVLNNWWINSMNYAIVITAIACMISSALLYYKIYLDVRRHANEIQALQPQLAQNGDMIANNTRQRKIAIATFSVFLVFLICYLPNTCINAVTIISGINSGLTPILRGFADTMAFLNSSLNPLIYCWKMRHIRHAVMNMLRNRHPGHN